jgi:hypothetical protein
MNTLVLLAILVLGCLALDIVTLVITMQLMVRIEDVVPEAVVSPSMQVKKDAPLIVAANHHFLLNGYN